VADEWEGLVAQLADGSWEVRQRAADQLGELGADAAPALASLRDKLLNDSDEDVRASAVRAAVAVAEDRESLLPDLVRGLADGHFKVRLAAAEALGKVGPSAQKVLDPLLDHAFDDNVDVQAAVVQAVGVLYPEPCQFLELARKMVTEQAERGPAALSVVGQMNRPDERAASEELLWEVLRSHAESRFYGTAFNSLVALGGDAAAVVRSVIADAELPLLRRGELYLLGIAPTSLDGELPDLIDEVLPAVLATFDSELMNARQAAAAWITEHRDIIPEPLQSSVVDAAVRCVTQYGECLDLLRDLVGDQAAIEVVNEIADPQRQAFLLFKEGKDLNGLLAPDRLTDLALAGLRDGYWVNRQAAADWIAGNVAALPPARLDEVIAAIRNATGDYDSDVRRSAELALIEVEQRGRVTRSSTLFDALRAGGDEAKVEVIQKILELRDRDTTRRLVREWIRWQACRKEPLLIEIVKEALRSQPEAVRPLVDQYDQVDQDPELDADILRLIEEQTGIGEGMAVLIRDESTERADSGTVADWLARRERTDVDISRLRQVAIEEAWKPARHAATVMDRLICEKRLEVRTTVRERVALQLADMSDLRYFTDDQSETYLRMQGELELHALPMLTRALAAEDTDQDNTTIREAAARALGNIGGREAVESLTRAVIGEERTRQRRQELLAEYYLEPSKTRSEEAATILRGAVKSAERTLRILQILNIALFCVGLTALAAGIAIGLATDDQATRVAAAFAGLGGLAGIVVELVRNPLVQIQRAMTRLVQLETAFTSFIWELNLNGTYIQSQYVARGVLSDEEIATTVGRIESAMTLAMDLVATHTQERDAAARPILHAATPVAGSAGSTIILRGEGLRGMGDVRRKARSLVAIDHVPLAVELSTWSDREVRFVLTDQQLVATESSRQVWFSLIVDGRETNAVPFTLLPSRVELRQPVTDGAIA
jgi:HEAT repeat protein